MSDYSLICKSSNVLGKIPFRIRGSWLISPSLTTDQRISEEVFSKTAYRIDDTLLLSNGNILQQHCETTSTKDSTETIRHRYGNNSNITSDCSAHGFVSSKIIHADQLNLLDIVKKQTVIKKDDDRFDLANKTVNVELYMEMGTPDTSSPTSSQTSSGHMNEKSLTNNKYIDLIPPQYKYDIASDLQRLIVDCLCFIDPLDKASSLFQTFCEHLDLYIRRSHKTIGNVIYHYLYDWCSLTISAPILAEATPTNLHHELNISSRQPVFSKTLNIFFNISNAMLKSVHRNVRALDTSSQETQCVVDGPYQYYHYMTDKFLNDKGWGCAYRSLQTIWSWFLLNGYTDKLVPSISDIQQILVMIGDKPVTFVNTHKWIGTVESSYVLEHSLKASSRIIHLNRIAELGEHAFAILAHFRNARCPIMIGGGTLAHTLLGITVDENNPTNSKFLVLDPHYSGEDNIEEIIEKGYCGWKGINFWKEAAYYNLCMPIPSMNN